MKILGTILRREGFHHPREIIAYAVWAYHRFALSTADVEDLLAERGVIVSSETIRLWFNRFGAHFAAVPGAVAAGMVHLSRLDATLEAIEASNAQYFAPDPA